MANFNKDTIIGVIGVVAGLLGVGYAIGTHSKLAKISERLDTSIDELANDMEFDIPEGMINKAIEKAAAIEAKKAVQAATEEALKELKKDIHTNVSLAVDKEYETIKDSVLKEITASASKIDANRIRREIEESAKKVALEKFDDNLEDILEKFNENLNNTSRIYNSIAGAMTRTTDAGKELVFKL